MLRWSVRWTFIAALIALVLTLQLGVAWQLVLSSQVVAVIVGYLVGWYLRARPPAILALHFAFNPVILVKFLVKSSLRAACAASLDTGHWAWVRGGPSLRGIALATSRADKFNAPIHCAGLKEEAV